MVILIMRFYSLSVIFKIFQLWIFLNKKESTYMNINLRNYGQKGGDKFFQNDWDVLSAGWSERSVPFRVKSIWAYFGTLGPLWHQSEKIKLRRAPVSFCVLPQNLVAYQSINSKGTQEVAEISFRLSSQWWWNLCFFFFVFRLNIRHIVVSCYVLGHTRDRERE